MPDNEACPDCGGRLRELGEDIAKMLDYVRASFKILRHVRPKLSCEMCDRSVQAPGPSRSIDRGLAGSSGTGKTRLMNALRVESCHQNKRVVFTAVAALINELIEASHKSQLSRALAQWKRGT